MKWLLYWRGVYRAWFGFCPKCDSSTPAMDSCNICRASTVWPRTRSSTMDWVLKYRCELFRKKNK